MPAPRPRHRRSVDRNVAGSADLLPAVALRYAIFGQLSTTPCSGNDLALYLDSSRGGFCCATTRSSARLGEAGLIEGAPKVVGVKLEKRVCSITDAGEATAVGESVRAETPRQAGASVVMDFIGSDETTALAAAVAAVGSQIVLVGLAGGRYPMAFGASPLEASVLLPNWGTRSELIEVVALARAGALDVSIERIRLEDVPATYEHLARGEVTGRAVATP